MEAGRGRPMDDGNRPVACGNSVPDPMCSTPGGSAVWPQARPDLAAGRGTAELDAADAVRCFGFLMPRQTCHPAGL